MKTVTSAEYLANQLAVCGKSQKEVAFECGYTKPNIITMFKQGTTRIPIAAAPKLAVAVGVDPAKFLRMVMSESHPEILETIENVLGGFTTSNEAHILSLFREATKNSNPAIEGKTNERNFMKAIRDYFK